MANQSDQEFIDEFINTVKKHGLGSYEIAKDEDGFAVSSYSYAWWHLPNLINFLKSQRGFKKPIYSINLSIILNSAIIAEGFLYELLRYEIGEWIKPDDLSSRLQAEIGQKLDKSTWNEMTKDFELITGKPILSYPTTKNWKAITTLFQFRNMLTHSRPILFTVEKEDDILKMKHFGKYETVYRFLIEKKLIDKIDFEKSMRTTLIDTLIADYFWSEAQAFLDSFFQCDDFQSSPIYDSYLNAFDTDQNF